MQRDPEQERSLNTAFFRAIRDVPGLPALEGTFRQVRWATTVRAKEARRLRIEADDGFEVREGVAPSAGLTAYLRRAVDTWLAREISAKAWIDMRDEPPTLFEVVELVAATRAELIPMDPAERAWLTALWAKHPRRRAPDISPEPAARSPLITPAPPGSQPEPIERVLADIKDEQLRAVLEAAAKAMDY